MDVHEEDGSARHAPATIGTPDKATAGSGSQTSPPLTAPPSQPRLEVLFLTIALLLVLAWYLPAETRPSPSFATSSLASSNLSRARDPSAPPDFPPATFHHLAQYSPYFALESAYVAPPARCTVDQVSILQRHGSRYPTSAAARVIQHTVDKLKRAAFGKGCCSPKLQFLRDWQYTLGEEDLVPLGIRE